MSQAAPPPALPQDAAEIPQARRGPGPDETQPSDALSPYKVTVGDDVYSQADFARGTDARFYNFTSGIGAGKTVAFIMRMAANALEWNAGEMGMVITPTSLGIKNVILPELAKWGFLDEWEYYGPQSEAPGLHLPNGARILLESADNDRKIERLRGPSIAWYGMDEPQLISPKAAEILNGRLRVGNYRNAFFTGTPKGRNWVWERCHPDSSDQWESVSNTLGVPSFANPHLPLDYRRDILDEFEGGFYDQEVLGQFVKFEGLVYRWFDREDYVGDYSDLDGFDEFVYGVDFGHSNPAAIVCLGRRGDQWIALETFYERRLTDEDLADEALRMVERNGEGTFYCDSADPGAIATMQRKGLTAKQSVKDITPGIKTVTSKQDNLYVDESCQPLITEFNQYQYPEDDDARDVPIDANNHALDALRYALHTHTRQGGEVSRSKHSLGGIM